MNNIRDYEKIHKEAEAAIWKAYEEAMAVVLKVYKEAKKTSAKNDA